MGDPDRMRSVVCAWAPGGDGEKAWPTHHDRQVRRRWPVYSSRSLAAGDKREGSLVRRRRRGRGSAATPAI